MNEQILTGKKYRVLADESTGLWNRISFWNKAADTEMDDGTSVEKKVTDLTSDLNTLNENLTASDNLQFKFGKDGDGNYGYYGADGSLIPFKSGVSEFAVCYCYPDITVWAILINKDDHLMTIFNGDSKDGEFLNITRINAGNVVIKALKTGKFKVTTYNAVNGSISSQIVEKNSGETLVSAVDKYYIYSVEVL